MTGMQKMLDSVQVISEETLKIASDNIKFVKQLKKFIEQKKDKYVAPAKAIIEEARATYDIYIKECAAAEITLKERARVYMAEQTRKQQEEQDKIAARVERGTMKPETAVKKIEAMPEVKKTVSSDNGSALRMTKRRVAAIENAERQFYYFNQLYKSVGADMPLTDAEKEEIKKNFVPPMFWEINGVAVRREALRRDKEGLQQVPGMVIREEESMQSVL